MVVRSYVQTPMGLQIVEVEVKMLAGLPQVHVVGQPDAHIKECGLRIKSALKSCGFAWPKGRQILVNLRPTYLRKHSRGLELAIVVGVLLESGQLSDDFQSWCADKIFYGEVGLSGEVFAPEGTVDFIEPGSTRPIVTGPLDHPLVEGEWWSVRDIRQIEKAEKFCQRVEWDQIWERPELPDVDFGEEAARLLQVSALSGQPTLVMGPQGTGKSTFARAAYALSATPDSREFREHLRITGLDLKWRALESPHHTTPAKAMVGGGSPLKAGVISKAHGGILLLDEFLEFDPYVIEALREPLEVGKIHLHRVSQGAVLPARFQLIATTNLCPCGKRAPGVGRACNYPLPRCKSVLARMSGPILDRFTLFGFSHRWIGGRRLHMGLIRDEVERARVFQKKRPEESDEWPESVKELRSTFRRKKALMRTARALADLDGSPAILDTHFGRAKELCLHPLEDLNTLYA